MLPSRPKAVLISLLASYLLSALLLFILTLVLYRLKLKESQITPAVYALYVISSAARRCVHGDFSGGCSPECFIFWPSLPRLSCCATVRCRNLPECSRFWPAARPAA